MRVLSRFILAAVPLAVIIVLSSCAPELYSSGGTSTYFGFTLGVESAPPPPQLVFPSEPRYIALETSDVRVVEAPDPSCDEFSYQGSFYLYSSGFWYRSSTYNGPFRVIEVRRVPRAVLMVPDDHWRHRPHWDRGEHRGQDNHGDRGHGGDHQ